jgi:hypothetical protein
MQWLSPKCGAGDISPLAGGLIRRRRMVQLFLFQSIPSIKKYNVRGTVVAE